MRIESAQVDQARAARQPRTLRSGDAAWVSVLAGPPFGQPPDHAPMPQAFLVDQSPGSQVPPHFHDRDQLQLVVDGSGRIGTHPVQPYALHYAARHTGYGPVVAGPRGLSYISIRVHADWVTHYFPEGRERQSQARRVNLHGAVDVAALVAGDTDTVVIQDADAGTIAHEQRYEHAAAVQPLQAGIHFAFVVAGTLDIGGQVLPARTLACVQAREGECVAVRARDGRTRVLWMRLPDG